MCVYACKKKRCQISVLYYTFIVRCAFFLLRFFVSSLAVAHMVFFSSFFLLLFQFLSSLALDKILKQPCQTHSHTPTHTGGKRLCLVRLFRGQQKERERGRKRNANGSKKKQGQRSTRDLATVRKSVGETEGKVWIK